MVEDVLKEEGARARNLVKLVKVTLVVVSKFANTFVLPTPPVKITLDFTQYPERTVKPVEQVHVKPRNKTRLGETKDEAIDMLRGTTWSADRGSAG